jgi:hypothetical protein
MRFFMIWPRLNARWNGVAALIWLLCGFAATVYWGSLSHRYLLGFLFWLFVGWLGPVLLLAISGSRSGSVANRICGVLAIFLILMAVFLFIFWIPRVLRA